MQLYGHNRVSILDGGLPKWISEGGEVISGPQPEVAVKNININHRGDLFSNL